MTNQLFSFCTKQSKEDCINPIEGLFMDFSADGMLQQHYYSNTEALAKRYNESIEQAIKWDCEWLVLHHDDIIFDTPNIADKLEELYYERGFQVIGVAGASRVKIEEPALWHIMGQKASELPFPPLHGAVAHGTYNEKYMTAFGVYPHKAVLIDGVFMAIHRDCFTKIRFDEACPSKFHYYDLIFSLDAALAGFKVGVGDIMITHTSPGLRDFTPEFLAGQEYFINKYSKYKGKIIEA